MLKYSKNGNLKLGKGVHVISRPVGDSCPHDCKWLNNACYAQKTERIFPNTRKAAFNNLRIKAKEFREFLIEAKKLDHVVRLSERGDFVKPKSQTKKNPQGKLDRDYLKAIELAIKSIPEPERPKAIFTYTHLYSSTLRKTLEKLGITVYASINCAKDMTRAKKAGFKLFAFASDIPVPHPTSNNRFEKLAALPSSLNINYAGYDVGPTRVCPEQRLKGNGKIKCDTCKICIYGKENVVFLKH